jgi:hypothetical protein
MIGAEKVTDGPIGAGTRFQAVLRAGRRTLPMDVEYTRVDLPHLIASRAHMSAADFSGTLSFAPAGSGTRLRWSWQVRPHGALRLVAPVLVRVGARQERMMWTRLRDHLEAEGDAVPDRLVRPGVRPLSAQPGHRPSRVASRRCR